MGRLKKNKVVYTLVAQKLIKKLSPQIKKGVRKAIDEVQEDPFFGKPLKDELTGYFSIRFKRYRVIYNFAEERQVITIIYVGKRVSVYEALSQFLKNKS